MPTKLTTIEFFRHCNQLRVPGHSKPLTSLDKTSAVSRCPLHTSILKCLSNTLRLPTANPVIAVILHVRADLIITLCELQISMLYLPKAPPQESASAVEAVTKERTAYVRVGTPQYLMTPSYYVCECRVLMSTYMHMHMIWISSMCVCVWERDTHRERERERERNHVARSVMYERERERSIIRVCICVCVWERERERKREREKERERERERARARMLHVHICPAIKCKVSNHTNHPLKKGGFPVKHIFLSTIPSHGGQSPLPTLGLNVPDLHLVNPSPHPKPFAKQNPDKRVNTHTHTYTHARVCVCVCVYVYRCTCVCI